MLRCLCLSVVLCVWFSSVASASFHFGLYSGIETADLDAAFPGESIEAPVNGGFGGLSTGYKFQLSQALFLNTAFTYSICPCEQVWETGSSGASFEVENRGIGGEVGLLWSLPNKSLYLDLGVRYALAEWVTETQLESPAIISLNLSDPKNLSASVRSFEPYVGVGYLFPLTDLKQKGGKASSRVTWLSSVRFFLRYQIQAWTKTKVEIEQWGGGQISEELSNTKKQQFMGGVAVEIKP